MESRISGSGKDTLTGTVGANTINGGAGKDTLTGAAGVDDFVFDTAPASANVDHITDFVHLQDVIDPAESLFSAAGPVGALAAAEFHAAASISATDTAHVLCNTTTGGLFYADGAGAGTAVQVAAFDNHATSTMTNTDIHVVGRRIAPRRRIGRQSKTPRHFCWGVFAVGAEVGCRSLQPPLPIRRLADALRHRESSIWARRLPTSSICESGMFG